MSPVASTSAMPIGASLKTARNCASPQVSSVFITQHRHGGVPFHRTPALPWPSRTSATCPQPVITPTLWLAFHATSNHGLLIHATSNHGRLQSLPLVLLCGTV